MLRSTVLFCIFLFNICIVANVDAYVNDFRSIPFLSLNKLKTLAGKNNSEANKTFLTRTGRSSSDHVGATQYAAASISSEKVRTEVLDKKMGAAAMSLGVVVTLGADMDPDGGGMMPMSGMLSVVVNIVDSTFPLTAQDAITLLLGEQAGVLMTKASNCGIKMAVKVVSLLSRMDFLVLDKSELISEIPTERAMIPQARQADLLSPVRSLVANPLALLEAVHEKHWTGEGEASNLTTICLYDDDSQSWDPVETFRDVTTWLSYSVLQLDFNDIYQVNNELYMDGILQSGVFGVLATLAAQIYADFLYGYFQVGDESQIIRVKERSTVSGVLHYTKASLVAFSFFAVYQFVKLPARKLITTFVSGGIDQCVGSKDVDICMETFVESGSHLLDASPLVQMETLLVSFGYIAHELPELVVNTQILCTVLASLWFRIIS